MSREKFEKTLDKKLSQIKQSLIANYEQDKDTYLSKYKYKGGTRKIADAPPPPCMHPEHEPPKMCVFEPGMYEHVCPACGKKTIFVVNGIYL